MLITELTLQNFRNHAFRQFEFSKKINFFIGKNGTGKTNILEAISLFSIQGGIRGAEMQDLNHNFVKPFLIGMQTIHGRVGLRNASGVKRFSIEDEASKFAEIEGKFRSISLNPEDEFIFRMPASLRRQFFDDLLGKITPQHLDEIKEYKNFCLQRMKILTQLQNQNSWLDVIEKQIAQKLVIISTNRVLFAERLSGIMQNLQERSLRGKILLSGYLENKAFSAINEEKLLKDMLLESRNLDAITGKTLTKMEKANFDVLFEEKGVLASKASSGEQKRMLFSLFISASKLGGFRVILLDEVTSKLDEWGRASIFCELSTLNAQIFATDVLESEGISGADFIHL